MVDTPAFLDSNRPDVPDLVVPRGILPFFLPDRPVRGRVVRLGPLADALLSRHDNPEPVSRLGGEALAMVAGLASALKFQGSFSLQVKGDGPVGMLLADCTDAGALRFHARFDAEKLSALLAQAPEPTARQLLGDGYLALTVDQGPDTERHQGIVAIEGGSLSEMAMHYFENSEQHDCQVRLACALTEGGWRAGALVLERIAGEGGILQPPELDNIVNGSAVRPDPDAPGAAAGLGDPDGWQEALVLARTLSDAELLDDALPAEQLLFRLFHENGVAADRPRALAYGCRCSRARLAGILETFPPDDLDHMDVGGDIVMRCEFCNVDFRFPRDSVHGAS
ncbi:Hsp33 family molecular chaperone HslO [Rhizosaccharibacter radicis]|uniref:Hsp33 family molecular chaperone HslO n=1 Tax=Rhizosaccharibacter radicis TaxID=2782605 RepID=A0ABT1W457_9PROT|nr:Hsp33 family molecular chaperone HslO [Acetobacteraceae bacterium KSS12]